MSHELTQQVDWPFQDFSFDVQLFYLLQSANYIALLIMLRNDTKRKDYTEASVVVSRCYHRLWCITL